MPLRQRLENLPVGQKLLAALLVLLATVLVVANLTFVSVAYWISHESTAPQALQTLGSLASNPDLMAQALDSAQNAKALPIYWRNCSMANICPCPSTSRRSTPGA